MTPARVVDIATRKPLGLGIIADDDDPPERDDMGRSSAYHGPQAAAAELVASSVALLSEEQLAAAPSWRDLLEHGIGAALAAVFDGDDAVLDRVRELKAEVAKAHGVIRELQLERERDRASLAEMRSKVAELDFVVSRLKVENAGPIGPPGPRGDAGARGPRGERGEAGVKAAGFVLDIGGYAGDAGFERRRARRPAGATAHVRALRRGDRRRGRGLRPSQKPPSRAPRRPSRLPGGPKTPEGPPAANSEAWRAYSARSVIKPPPRRRPRFARFLVEPMDRQARRSPYFDARAVADQRPGDPSPRGRRKTNSAANRSISWAARREV